MSITQHNDYKEEFIKIHIRIDGLEKLLLAILNNIEARCYKCNYAKSDSTYSYDPAVRCKYWNECHNSICKYCASCKKQSHGYPCEECDSVRNLCDFHRTT